MKVTALTDIKRQETPVQYRRSYTAIATFTLPSGETAQRRVAFTVEEAAVGEMRVKARVTEPLDYPLVPASRALREAVVQTHENGGLP